MPRSENGRGIFLRSVMSGQNQRSKRVMFCLTSRMGGRHTAPDAMTDYQREGCASEPNSTRLDLNRAPGGPPKPADGCFGMGPTGAHQDRLTPGTPASKSENWLAGLYT